MDSGSAVRVGLVERMRRLGDLAEPVGEHAVVRATDLLEDVGAYWVHIAVEYGDDLRLGDPELPNPELPNRRVFLGFLWDFELEDDTLRIDCLWGIPPPVQVSLLVERGREVGEADGPGRCHYGELAVVIEVLADRIDGLERGDAAIVEDGAVDDGIADFYPFDAGRVAEESGRCRVGYVDDRVFVESAVFDGKSRCRTPSAAEADHRVAYVLFRQVLKIEGAAFVGLDCLRREPLDYEGLVEGLEDEGIDSVCVVERGRRVAGAVFRLVSDHGEVRPAFRVGEERLGVELQVHLCLVEERAVLEADFVAGLYQQEQPRRGRFLGLEYAVTELYDVVALFELGVRQRDFDCDYRVGTVVR